MSVLILDMNSIGNAANAMTKLTVGGAEMQAVYGSLITVRELITRFPSTRKVVGLWDGQSERRIKIFPEYKANRTLDLTKPLKDYEAKAQQAKESYRKQKPYIMQGLSLLGISQVVPTVDEADDWAGYLCRRLTDRSESVTLVSRDHDWLQLVRHGVDWYNPFVKETVSHVSFETYTGYEDPYQFLQEKALIGDKSDNINGVKGIGKVAAQAILAHYGNVQTLLAENSFIWSPPTPELRKFGKKIMDFIDPIDTSGRTIFYRNMDLMNLIDTKVDIASAKMSRTRLDDAAFHNFCDTFVFRSILRNYNTWLKPFRQLGE